MEEKVNKWWLSIGLVSMLKSQLDDFMWSLKLYSLTAIIPFALTLLYPVFTLWFDLEIGKLFLFWKQYYVTGQPGTNIASWKIHLGLLFLCFIFTKIEKLDEF